MKIQQKGQLYTSLPIGERITISHYFLEDDARLIPAPAHTIGNEVAPWDVGLWFKADMAKPATLYVDTRGGIHKAPPGAVVPMGDKPRFGFIPSRTDRPPHGGFPDSFITRLKKAVTMPESHQRAAVTADALGDWEGPPMDVGLSAKALTFDDGKPPLAHLPWAGVDAVARVQLYGHKKYKDFYNYRKGMEVSRNASCAIRHIRDYMNGQDNDVESGENHLAHAATRLLFIIQNLADGTAIDDRYSKRKRPWDHASDREVAA